VTINAHPEREDEMAYDPSDPYRYGPPPVPTYGDRATGKQILSASWRLLRQDPELIGLPLIGTLAGLFAAAILFVPGWALGRALSDSNHVAAWVGGALAVLALTTVGIFFEAALVIGANDRAEGRTPTIGSTLGRAWQLRGPIIAWALVTTTVGMVIRALEERLGILGKIVGFVAGLAWAVASFFVVPVIVVEGLGPIAAVKRSASLIRSTWGTSLRTTLRFGFIQLAALLPVFALVIAGVVIVQSDAFVLGAALIALGVVAFIGLGSLFGAVTTYAGALIYRYAVGRPVPGVPDGLLGGAFSEKRRRRRR
jgi:Family of unknown function (DUF6159)